jgi:hypothetical protein
MAPLADRILDFGFAILDLAWNGSKWQANPSPFTRHCLLITDH